LENEKKNFEEAKNESESEGTVPRFFEAAQQREISASIARL
jgi:hypothetical protein